MPGPRLRRLERDITDHPTYKRIIPASIAQTVHDILTTVVTSGTGTSAAIPGVDVAGKTGTTTNYGDAWFVGWTPADHHGRVGRLPRLAWSRWPRCTTGPPSREAPIRRSSGRDFMTQALQILANEQAATGPVELRHHDDRVARARLSGSGSSSGSLRRGTSGSASSGGTTGGGTTGGGTTGGGTTGGGTTAAGRRVAGPRAVGRPAAGPAVAPRAGAVVVAAPAAAAAVVVAAPAVAAGVPAAAVVVAGPVEPASAAARPGTDARNAREPKLVSSDRGAATPRSTGG